MESGSPLLRHQFPSVVTEGSLGPRDRRAHEQFAIEYAEQTRLTRAALLGTAK
jgi:hypothetical protein